MEIKLRSFRVPRSLPPASFSFHLLVLALKWGRHYPDIYDDRYL